MIFNQPTFESLNASALRFHFAACELLFEVIREFNDFHAENHDGSEVTWLHEWNEYLTKAQFDLEGIYTNMAQANELALRAMICDVSPYLLLLNTENRFKSNSSDVDFTELRTIDAVDLPSTINSICSRKLSDQFITNFNLVRSIRNKIMHLGNLEGEFSREKLVSLLCGQYTELWEGKQWLPNWISYAERKRTSHFFDYKNFTEFTEVMGLIPIIQETLTKSQFEKLFGFPKSQRRYICHSCCYVACIERHGAYLPEYKTAALIDENNLYCAMCDETYPVSRTNCPETDCLGNVVFGREGFADRCCSCGLS